MSVGSVSVKYRLARVTSDGELKFYRGRPAGSLSKARIAMKNSKIDSLGRYNPAKRRNDVIVEIYSDNTMKQYRE